MSFIVSETTLEFGFSSFFLLASTAACTKLLKHFFGVYSTERCIFVTARTSCQAKGINRRNESTEDYNFVIIL